MALLYALIIFDTARLMLAKHAIHDVDEAYVMGQKDGDLELVEFLDYGCGHCQDLHPILTHAMVRDGQVRYIIRPIFTGEKESGTIAARMVYAAGRQGKFEEAHNLLIENFRPIDDSFIESFVLSLELDAAQLKEDMKDPEIDKMLIENVENLQVLKGQVVPALLMNGNLLFQVSATLPDTNQILSLFNQSRAL